MYVLDSNIFIQAHRANYPLDVFPSFWSVIHDLSNNHSICSIDKVKIEIYEQAFHEDELKKWCLRHLPKPFFIDTQKVIRNYAQVIQWAHEKRHGYSHKAIQQFSETNLADPWLVAFAMDGVYTIVTQETSDPNSKKRIKIPDVCKAFNIPYTNTVGMLRELKQVV